MSILDHIVDAVSNEQEVSRLQELGRSKAAEILDRDPKLAFGVLQKLAKVKNLCTQDRASLEALRAAKLAGPWEYVESKTVYGRYQDLISYTLAHYVRRNAEGEPVVTVVEGDGGFRGDPEPPTIIASGAVNRQFSDISVWSLPDPTHEWYAEIDKDMTAKGWKLLD